jgi:predicted dehydrogenase
MVIYEDGAPEPVRLFDRGVVYHDPETFGEYHLSYRSGDILSPKIDSYEPLSLELADFVRSIRNDEPMEFHTALARSVVRIVEAADRSLLSGGSEIRLESEDISNQLSTYHELAVV